MIFVFTGIQLLKFIFESFKIIGKITTPLSLFYVGIVIYEMRREKFRFSKEAFMVFLGRFLITPAVVLILNSFIEVLQLMRNVFI